MRDNSLGFYLYRPAAWLRIAGSDAKSFVQGQFTNDIRLVGPDRAVYGLWLNQKGRVLADSFVAAGDSEDAFWIGSYFSLGETIRRRLEEYLVADEVTVEDLTADWAGISLIGEGAGAWLAREAAGIGRIFPGRRASGENWEWAFPFAQVEAARRKLAGARIFDASEVERHRIAAGIPAVPADIGPGDLPNEGGLEEGAISATKGCYLGQEIMARLKSKGRIRRRLFSVAGRGPAPALPALLQARAEGGGRAAGELRSAVADAGGAGFIGLALLNLAGRIETESLYLAEKEGESRTVEIV